MNDSEKKYSNEKMMKIGRLNIEKGKSIRELAKKFSVSKSTVSKAKDVYLAYIDGVQTGEQEKERKMKNQVNRLKDKIEKLSPQQEETESEETSTINPDNYSKNNPKKDPGSEDESEASVWGWVSLLVGLLLAGGSLFFRDGVND